MIPISKNIQILAVISLICITVLIFYLNREDDPGPTNGPTTGPTTGVTDGPNQTDAPIVSGTLTPTVFS